MMQPEKHFYAFLISLTLSLVGAHAEAVYLCDGGKFTNVSHSGCQQVSMPDVRKPSVQGNTGVISLSDKSLPLPISKSGSSSNSDLVGSLTDESGLVPTPDQALADVTSSLNAVSKCFNSFGTPGQEQAGCSDMQKLGAQAPQN